MKKSMHNITGILNDLKYAFISIAGWVVAHIPEWVAHLADWFVLIAQIGGGLAVAFGVLKMIDQFLLHRIGIDIFRRYARRNKKIQKDPER